MTFLDVARIIFLKIDQKLAAFFGDISDVKLRGHPDMGPPGPMAKNAGLW